MLPLVLVLASLSLLVLAAIVIAQLQFRKINKRLVAIDRDLRQFYCDLGRPKAEIISIRKRKRPSS